jgi:hypothetical protein
LIGNGGSVSTAEFSDPFGAKTYVAYTPNYDVGRLPAAYKLVSDAQKLREQWDAATGSAKADLAVAMKEKIKVLDILRQLHDLFGQLDY